MKLTDAISKRITMLCDEREFDIEHLVANMNTNPHEVMAVINGYGPISLNIIGDICLLLGITMFEFFYDSLFEEF